MSKEAIKQQEAPILRDLQASAARLGIDAQRLKHAADRLDIAVVILEGKMFFREEALQEWAVRNERRAW